MKAIQDGAAFFFITAVGVLSAISILGVWNPMYRDVISKSFETLGLLAVVSMVVIIAGRFIDARQTGAVPVPYVPNPSFHSLRRFTLAVLIVLAAILALLGVLAIWDVVSDKGVLWKSLGSLAILAFSTFIIVLTCLERENIPTVNPDGTTSASASSGLIVTILGLLIAGWVIMSALGSAMGNY
jgi:hypothetical protein